MPMKVLDATISTFEGVLEKFRSEGANNKANLILFLADKDPSTYLSWCPESGCGSTNTSIRVTEGMKIFAQKHLTKILLSSQFSQFMEFEPLEVLDRTPSLLSWHDCVRAEPVIYKKLEESSDNVALLRAYVGDRPTWRNPHHPWRTDSRFKLKGVPTLIRWDDAIKARLEDHEAHLEHKINTLLSEN